MQGGDQQQWGIAKTRLPHERTHTLKQHTHTHTHNTRSAHGGTYAYVRVWFAPTTLSCVDF